MTYDEGPTARRSSEVLVALLRRFWIILLCLVLGGEAGFLVSQFTSPVYQAEANLMVTQVSESPNAEAARLTNYTRAYSQLATSPEVIGDAVRESGADPRDIPRLINIDTSLDTPLIQVNTNADDPQKAADLANSVGSAVVSFTEEISEETRYEAAVVAEATPPEDPSWPNTPLNVAVGATSGLLVGGAVALARGDRPRRAGRARQRDAEERVGTAFVEDSLVESASGSPDEAELIVSGNLEGMPSEEATASEGVTEEPLTQEPKAPERVRMENDGTGESDFWFRRSRRAGLAAESGFVRRSVGRGGDIDRLRRRARGAGDEHRES